MTLASAGLLFPNLFLDFRFAVFDNHYINNANTKGNKMRELHLHNRASDELTETTATELMFEIFRSVRRAGCKTASGNVHGYDYRVKPFKDEFLMALYKDGAIYATAFLDEFDL